MSPSVIYTDLLIPEILFPRAEVSLQSPAVHRSAVVTLMKNLINAPSFPFLISSCHFRLWPEAAFLSPGSATCCALFPVRMTEAITIIQCRETMLLLSHSASRWHPEDNHFLSVSRSLSCLRVPICACACLGMFYLWVIFFFLNSF